MKKGATAIVGAAVSEKIHPTSISGTIPQRFADFLALTKPRLNSLVIVTAAMGTTWVRVTRWPSRGFSRRLPALRSWRAELPASTRFTSAKPTA